MTIPVAKVLYPGSFDPLHKGHVELIENAVRLFDQVVVAAMVNPQKAGADFSLDERRAMIEESLAHLPTVSVHLCSGLVVAFAKEVGAEFIVKGLRTVGDFETELQMALMNQAVSGVRTVFLPADSAHAFVSSRYIRDIARMGGDVAHLVPAPVAARLKERYA